MKYIKIKYYTIKNNKIQLKTTEYNRYNKLKQNTIKYKTTHHITT